MLNIILFLIAMSGVGNGVSPETTSPVELQGTWKLVSVTAAAGTVDLPEQRPLLTIRGNRLVFGGEDFARLSADSGTDPKVFDLHLTAPERVYEGIYSVANDSLQVCINGRTEGVKERPNTFALDEQPIRRLLKFERVTADDPVAGSGFVGMALAFDEAQQHVRVQQVLRGSPAQKADLQQDDVLLTVGGTAVTDLRSAVEAVRRAKPRAELKLGILRGGEDREVKVRVGVLPFQVLTGLD